MSKLTELLADRVRLRKEIVNQIWECEDCSLEERKRLVRAFRFLPRIRNQVLVTVASQIEDEALLSDSIADIENWDWDAIIERIKDLTQFIFELIKELL